MAPLGHLSLGQMVAPADWNALVDAINGMRMPGEMTAWAGASAPPDWLLCDGAAVSRTTYAALFAVIATTFGAGDGSTTFNVPDMRGKAAYGKAAAGTAATLGSSFGALDHTHTYTQVPNHTHPITDPGHSHGNHIDPAAAGPAPNAFITTSNWNGVANRNTEVATTGITGTGNPAGGVSTGTTNTSNPPGLVANYIIKT
jgi:microcystin-dependent protein